MNCLIVMIPSKVPHLEYCPLHDISDTEIECMVQTEYVIVVLYPPLRPGDRVIRGPDWQWGSQGKNEEGVVLCVKDWKGMNDKGVRVRWDNGDENMYRYGADGCYDVCE